MKGESSESLEIGRAIDNFKKVEKRHPEKLPFHRGDVVWVRNRETGEMEEKMFLAWNPDNGKVIVSAVQSEEAAKNPETSQILDQVDRDDVMAPEKKRKLH